MLNYLSKKLDSKKNKIKMKRKLLWMVKYKMKIVIKVLVLLLTNHKLKRCNKIESSLSI